MTALTAELGDRAADALRAENAGLTCQRLNVIRSRIPVWGWLPVYEGGVCVQMVWRGWP